jgi:DsbC/DsbD-like thiol-disulfide interchange protein
MTKPEKLYGARHQDMIAVRLRAVQSRCIYFRMRFSLNFLLLVPALAGAADAAESNWYETDGVRLQLLTEDKAGADGQLRAVLKVDLQPGWKTYWMDPGDAGVPPQVDAGKSQNITAATIHFPAPKRFDEGSTHWAGYSRPIDLPVTFRVADPSKFTAIDATVFIGVCQDVCIPVQTMLSVTPDPQAETNPAGVAIDAAFASLPGEASSQFGVTRFQLADNEIIAKATLPATGAGMDLFVVAPSGWTLAAPKPGLAAGVYSIHVVGRPAGGELPKSLQYTLVSGDRSVTGSADLR